MPSFDLYTVTGGMSPDNIGASLVKSAPVVTITGIIATTKPFSLQQSNGEVFEYSGGTIDLLDNYTNYLVLSVGSKTLHTLSRLHDTGVIHLATITTVNGSVTDVYYPELKLPICKIPRTVESLADGSKVRIAALGSSLIAGAGPSPRWFQQNFDSANSGLGFNLPNIENVTFANFAVGGMDALYSHAITGTSVMCYGGEYATTSYVSQHYRMSKVPSTLLGFSDKARTNTGGRSSVFSYDLVLIGLLPNGGNAQLDYYEAVIRKIRQEGIEVLLVTDNAFAGSDSLYTEGDWVAGMARKYGCAVADTAAFMRESELRGGSAYSDAIHQGVDGHTAWARSVHSNFSGIYSSISETHVPKALAAPSTKFPSDTDICFTVASNTGSELTRIEGGVASSFCGAYGMTAGYYSITPSSAFRTGHPLMLGMFLIIDGTTAFTAEVTKNNNSNVIKTISNSAYPRVNRVDVFKAADFASENPTSDSYRITVTSGEMRLVAIGHYTPKYVDISDNVISSESSTLYGGSYGGGRAAGQRVDVLYNNLSIDYPECRSLIVSYQQRNTSGVAKMQYDNNQEDIDMFSNGHYYSLYNPSGFGGKLGHHSLTATYVSLNASAGPITSTSGRLFWPNAFAVLDR